MELQYPKTVDSDKSCAKMVLKYQLERSTWNIGKLVKSRVPEPWAGGADFSNGQLKGIAIDDRPLTADLLQNITQAGSKKVDRVLFGVGGIAVYG